MPLFSVIIPTRNRVSLLLEAIRSVEDQSFRDFEIIISDDFSDEDFTPEIHEINPAVRVVRQNMQSGPSATRNRGMAVAIGDYIAFLDDDDLWMPWTLEAYADAIVSHDRPAWLSSNGAPFTVPADLAGVVRTQADERIFPDYLAYRTNRDQPGWLLPTGVAIRRDVALAVGGFDPALTHHEDEDLWLRIGTSPRFVRIAAPLCWGYRSHAGGASLNLERRFKNLHQLIGRERNGEYPGGQQRRGERLDVISQLGRHLSRLGAKNGQYVESAAMYGDLLFWNVARSRWKFLVMFPLEFVAHIVIAPLFRMASSRKNLI